MPEFNRLSGKTALIDLELMERQRTPEFAIQPGIQLHLAGLSLSNSRQHLERLGVERSQTAIHDWVRTADLQPDGDVDTDQIAVDADRRQRPTSLAVRSGRSRYESVPSRSAVSDADDATHRAVPS
jgi:hypothetical protein